MFQFENPMQGTQPHKREKGWNIYIYILNEEKKIVMCRQVFFAWRLPIRSISCVANVQKKLI